MKKPAPKKAKRKRSSPAARPARGENAKNIWRNRIVGHDDVDPKKLIAHDANWRDHPASQVQALDELIGRIGFLSSVKVSRASGRIIDGHLRVRRAIETRQTSIPVEYLDLDPREEFEALLTFDAVALMARARENELDALRDQVQLDPNLFAGLDAELDRLRDLTDSKPQAENGQEANPASAPAQTLVDQYKIVLTCRDEAHQTEILDAMENSPQRLGKLLKGIGCRALIG